MAQRRKQKNAKKMPGKKTHYTAPSAQALLQQGLEHHRKGQIEQAQNCYEKSLELEHEHPEALHMLGLVNYQTGNAEEGARLISRSLELAPKNTTAMGNLASIKMSLNRREEAVPLLQEAVRLAPQHGPAWRSLGDALASLGRLSEAAQAYEHALEAWPTGVDKGGLPHNYAVTLSGLGQHETAASLLKKILQAQPGNLSAHCNLGHALRELEQFEDACKAFTSALGLEPDMPQAHLGLAGCLEKLGELDNALEHARKARELNPCEDTWFREAHLLQADNDCEAARDCYRKALACNPRCTVAMNNLGVLDMNENLMDAAAHWFQRARDCDPTYAEAWTNWANILEKQGELERAEVAASRGVELEESPSSLVRLGYVLQRQGRIEDALKVYGRLLEIDPADTKGVTLYLAGLGLREMPSRASEAHVRELFDYYAGFFEKHLRERLEYRGPEVMLSLLSPCLQERDIASPAENGLDFMDLGCGTGLCGAVVSPFARRLDGVDLSPRMLAKAQARGIYHDLFKAELEQCLEEVEREYDCVLAGDVFVYLGDLEPVFAAVARRLRPGGYFAFTLETHSGQGVKVNEGNRYQHSREYLRELAARQGFSLLTMDDVVMRVEAQQPVESLAVLLHKPSA